MESNVLLKSSVLCVLCIRAPCLGRGISLVLKVSSR